MKHQFLDLGRQPIANGFLYADNIKDEYFFNLKVGFDTETGLVTQMEYVDPPLMFNENYAYRGSMSQTMRTHFKELSDCLQTKSNIKILEIGSNDGVFIKNWDKKNSITVEPCKNFAEETRALGYKTYDEFWSTKLAWTIWEKHKTQDIIFAANCICHIPDLDDAFKAVELLLTGDGIFVFEDPSLAGMINNNSYDQIYDEHPHIFSVIALDNILQRNGLQIIRVENLSVHGGSNRIFASKIGKYPINESVEKTKSYERILGLDNFETFTRFAKKVRQSREDLIRILIKCKNEGKQVISYGATSKSTTIFNYCKITPELIKYIIDTTPDKQGKLSPGMHIPIAAPNGSIDDSIDYVYLGAWNFIDEISNKESKFLDRGGKFITHVPTVKFV